MLHLARAALARPLLVLALLALGTAAAARGLFRLELRTDGAAIYPRGDPVVERTLADRGTFLEADQILLLVTARRGGPRLDTPAGFRYLLGLQHALERFPGVELAGVRSVVTLLDPPEKLRPLLIQTFFEEWSGGEAGFADLLARMRRLPVTGGMFLSADGAAAAFYVPAAAGATRTELLDELRRFLATRAGSRFRLRLTGPVAAEAELGEEVVRDIARLVPIVAAVMALLLALSLRTAAGVLIPLAQVAVTLVWTLGLMGWAGVPVTLVTAVLPVLLMAMAMTDEIYLLERLEDHLGRMAPGPAASATAGVRAGAGVPAEAEDGRAAGPAAARARVRRAAERSFDDLVAPLVLISLSTAAGFFSFLGASMAPLRHLGLFTGIGLLLGMLFTFTLAPALIAALPPAWLERRTRRHRPPRDARGLLPFERLTVRRPRAAALAVGVLVAAALPGLTRLRVEDAWIDNFDPRSSLVTAARRFDAEFWGSYRFDVVCAGAVNTFWTPEAAALLEEIHRWGARAPHVGGVVSVLPAFEAGAKALGLHRPLSALPPLDMRRVGMLVEVLRIRLYLRDLLSLDGDHLRVHLLVRDADYAKARALTAAFAAELPRLAGGRPIAVHASGEVPAALAVVAAIVSNQLRSIGWTAALIAAILLGALRSLRWTAAVMAPVAAATLLLLAGMGYAALPLGIATSMFAALNLGAGVDFAVQYAYAYRRERRQRPDHVQAIAATLRTTGRGLRWNALVLSLGIAVLTLSAIKPNQSLGLLLALAIVISYATTLALLPELLGRLASGSSELAPPAGDSEG
jgi:predicted RND superfamily exporter protein